MALARLLEDFEAASPDESAGPAPESLPGFEAGFAAGLEAARRETERLDAELVQTLSDMKFGFAEARQTVLAGLGPLFDVLADRLLPQLSEPLFRTRLIAALQTAAGRQLGQPIRLSVAPGQVDALTRLLPRVTGIDLEVQPNPRLTPHAALISQGVSEQAIDIDRVLSESGEILATFGITVTEAEETLKHG